jgi:hypothetical protein
MLLIDFDRYRSIIIGIIVTIHFRMDHTIISNNEIDIDIIRNENNENLNENKRNKVVHTHINTWTVDRVNSSSAVDSAH